MTEKGTTSFWEKYSMQIAIVAGALILGGALYFGDGDKAGQQAQNPEAAPTMEVDVANVKTAGSPYVGNPNAPLTMAVWFDYNCVYCKALERDTMPQIISTYVDAGKLKIVYKDFQFQGPNSTNTALFGRAMWEAYPAQHYAWLHGVAGVEDETLANVKAVAAALPGVDADRVEKLMNDKKDEYQAAIDADYAEGVALGIQGTPGVIVGKTFINGAMPFAEFASAIDAELK